MFTNVSPNKRRWHCLPGSHSTSESLLSVALFLNYCTNSTIHISTGIKQINSTEFKIFSSCKTVVHILISSNMYINTFNVRKEVSMLTVKNVHCAHTLSVHLILVYIYLQKLWLSKFDFGFLENMNDVLLSRA